MLRSKIKWLIITEDICVNPSDGVKFIHTEYDENDSDTIVLQSKQNWTKIRALCTVFERKNALKFHCSSISVHIHTNEYVNSPLCTHIVGAHNTQLYKVELGISECARYLATFVKMKVYRDRDGKWNVILRQDIDSSRTSEDYHMVRVATPELIGNMFRGDDNKISVMVDRKFKYVEVSVNDRLAYYVSYIRNISNVSCTITPTCCELPFQITKDDRIDSDPM
jgi:hypothetical protein